MLKSVSDSLASDLLQLGCVLTLADLIAKSGPVLAVIGTTALAAGLNLDAKGLRILGESTSRCCCCCC